MAAGSAVAKARHDELMASTALRAVTPAASGEVEAAGPHAAPARPINDALSSFIVAVHRQGKARSVALERITSAAAQQQSFAGAEALAREVPLTGGRIRAVRLSMQGHYADYQQFKRFLDDMAYLSAIQSLKLNGDRFEAITEIYGVAS